MKIRMIITLILNVIFCISQLNGKDFYIVNVDLGDDEDFSIIEELNLDVANEQRGRFIQIVADDEKILLLSQAGVSYRIIKELSAEYIPDYPSYDEVLAQLDVLHNFFPDITEIYQIGVSQEYQYPIYAMKVSDNAAIRENETTIWIDAVHHAREPMGMMSCMSLLEHLLSNYGNDEVVTNIVDSLEIWIVPILNTEGYIYFIDSTNAYPWWRKNQHDNNENQVFDFNQDGVDLNRNYDVLFYESSSGSPDSSSWVYRGTEPFSETETTAKREMVEFLRPLTGISYHSYGEILYYNSGINGHSLPETAIIEDFALQIAIRIPHSVGTPSYLHSPSWNGAPMSYYWMFQVLGSWEILIETGTEFVPQYAMAQQIAQDNVSGSMYLLERSLEGPGIKGNVISSFDGSPVDAVVKIVEYWDPDLTPRRTEPTFGRFNRFTDAGIYTLEISAYNYKSDTLENVLVDTGWTNVEIHLTPFSIVTIMQVNLDDDQEGDSNGNGDGDINSGEQIELDIELANSGIIRSANITLVLTTDDDYVTLIDSSQTTLPINADSSILIPGAFIFSVAEDCPDKQALDFTVNVFDSLGYTWTDTIRYIVVPSELAIPTDGTYMVEIIPSRFNLHSNYPNPFNPVTTIKYDLPVQSHVKLVIFDLLGREVKILINRAEEPGFKSVVWDGRNDVSEPLSTGVYIYKIQTGDFSQTRKMILLQ